MEVRKRCPHTKGEKFCFGKTRISSFWAAWEPQTPPGETHALDRLLRRTDGRSDAPDRTGDREASQERDSGKDKISTWEMMREGDREGGRSSQFKDPSPKSGGHSSAQAEGLLPLVVWLPRSLRRRGRPGPRTRPAEALLSTQRRLQSLKSLLRRRASVAAGDHLAPTWASSRNPRPRTVPLVLTESFNELGEDPGVAFHETPLPGIARHGPDHTPPRSTSPQHKLPPAADLSKTRRGASTPTSPRLLPDSLRAPSPAARRSAERRSSHPGDVETPLRPLRIRSALRRRRGGASGRWGEVHPGPLAPRSWGGAMEGAGLGTRRGSLRPEPGAVLALSGRRLFPVLRRTSVGAADPEHRLPGTGGSLQARCGPGNRVLCSPSDPGHLRSGRCALSSTRIPALEARQSLRRRRRRRLCAPAPAEGVQDRFRIRTFRTWPSCSGGWSLRELRSTLPLAKLLESLRAKGPFSLFLSLFLRLWHRGVV